MSRIFIVGHGEGRSEIEAAFEASLVSEAELADRPGAWLVAEDGLEDWLGPINASSFSH
ncbi:hypothetical protein J2S70_001373 [Trueperella bonasi]|uniref:Uncharacterized protein n=2 Tax=Trueperella bonasi TaxID=312286 RepID=A0ABT9NHC0_9ACTO|nr:hypothetical protein [Trueperella bonasi]